MAALQQQQQQQHTRILETGNGHHVIGNSFTGEELDELRQIFTIYDADGDGLVAVGEMLSLLKGIGVDVTEDELTTTHAVSGMNCDEFIRFLAAKRQSTDPEAELRNVFQLFDKDSDGFLTFKELKHAMQNVGEKMTDDEVAEMIRIADADRDGKLNYNEFARIMRLSTTTSPFH